MNNQKGFVKIVLVVFVVVLVGAVGYFTLAKKSQFSMNEVQPTNNSGWEKYSGTSLEFEYPSLISVKQEGENITLSHSIVYKHSNQCDFKGDAPSLEKLSDFDVSIMVSNKNLKDTLHSNQGSDYIIKNFFENNTLKLSEGFIDGFNVGSLNGFQITSGVEGCGRYTYYFPMSSTKTLVVNRSFISEFNPINGDYQTYLNLSGIIPPNQEKEFFVKILSSLKVKPKSIGTSQPMDFYDKPGTITGNIHSPNGLWEAQSIAQTDQTQMRLTGSSYDKLFGRASPIAFSLDSNYLIYAQGAEDNTHVEIFVQKLPVVSNAVQVTNNSNNSSAETVFGPMYGTTDPSLKILSGHIIWEVPNRGKFDLSLIDFKITRK